MRKNRKMTAVLYAVAAAVLYALNVPFSKIFLQRVEASFMASFLYLGAGFGVGGMYLFRFRGEKKADRLTKSDLPYTVGMVVLDIAAPILLMLGIRIGSAANASLLGNFEIVATTLIALLLFGERVSRTLWAAIGFIVTSCAVLSFEGAGSVRFSLGSLLVLAATVCWGLENNCTRKISEKSTYEIVLIKGIFSGMGSLGVALAAGEAFPAWGDIPLVMLLGFGAYGLSIFFYVRAQRDLGAAKTSAYYAISPFVGAVLAFAVNGEALTAVFFAGLALMLVGTALVVRDTLHSGGEIFNESLKGTGNH